MTFDEWDNMPLSEQHHRLAYYIACQQWESDAMEDAKRDREDREIQKLAQEETGEDY